MSQFRVIADVENIGRNTRSKKMIDAKNVNAKRGGLQPLDNGIVQNAKRVKLNSSVEVKYEKIHLDENSSKEKPQQTNCLSDTVELKNILAPSSTAEQLLPKCIPCVWEYINNFWDHLCKLEKLYPAPKPSYMDKQVQLDWNFRSIVIEWLAVVADTYNMANETLHLSVNYIDRFLCHYRIAKNKLQLVASSAMLLASKIEEIYPIGATEYSYLTKGHFKPRQILKMERLIVRKLGFRIQPPTMANFIQHFCNEHNLNTKTMCLAMYISELVLLEGNYYLNYLPSKLAAASIALARYTLSDKPWPRNFQNQTGYSLKQLSPIVMKQHQFLIDSLHKEQQDIQTKYKSEKYHSVALLKPRNLQIDMLDEEDQQSLME